MSDRCIQADYVPWEQGPKEPDRWYARFTAFRDQGPDRTIANAYRICTRHEGLQGKKPDSDWYRQAKRWRWRERATAWDRHVEADQQHGTRVPTPAANETRASMIDSLLSKVFRSLEAADLDGMDTAEARDKLPAIRMLFKDLIAAQREELGGSPSADDNRDAQPFTADELIAAQRELEQWRNGRDSTNKVEPEMADSDDQLHMAEEDETSVAEERPCVEINREGD